MALAKNLAQIFLPKKKAKAGGTSYTPTFRQNTGVLTAPLYRQHLTDLYTSRSANDSRTLLNDLVNHDPDVSAAVHSYLTIAASSQLVVQAYTSEGELDAEGIKLANQVLNALTTTYDYTLGFSNKPTLSALTDEFRYMVLLRGEAATELVLDKRFQPTELRVVDSSTLTWQEKTPGKYIPIQKPKGGNVEINLDIPTFFVSRYHQNPTDIYSYSPFVSAINTVAARQQVINELYRIMQVVGYPRLDITVLEDVLMKHAPAVIRADKDKQRAFIQGEVEKIRASFANIRSDAALVHTNAAEAQIINDKNPGAGLQIQQVIDTLDAQNQSSLKVMPAVVGKGANLQTASTEARLFAMSADALNQSIADLYSQVLTLACRLAGFDGYIVATFVPVELRPTLELEPQLTMKSSRLKQDLSLGLLSDDEYHLQMYGRPKPAAAPDLSGTGFLEQQTVGVDASSVSPNSDSLGRSMAPEGGKSAKSNATKSGQVK